MAVRAWNVLSVCSGVGGLDLGVRLAVPDARNVLYVEREARAAADLVARVRDGSLDPAPVWSDLRTLDGGAWRGVVDCVVAGIPCQGYSLAGKRLLHEDERSLWPDLRRVLRDVGCEYLFLENVPGFLVPDRKRGETAPVVRVLGELAEDGFDAEWMCLAAEDLGSSHVRDRVFLLARRASGVGQADAGRQRVPGRTRTDKRRVGGAKGKTEGGSGQRQRVRDAAGDGSTVVEYAESRDGDVHARRGRKGRGAAESGGGSAPVADATGAERRTNGRADGRGKGGRGKAPGASGCGVGDPDDAGREQRRSAESGGEELAASEHDGSPVGHATGVGRGEGSGQAPEGQPVLAVPGEGLPLWPPGPGLGGHGVVDELRDLLGRSPEAAWRRYQAELDNTLRWVRILEVRPELAPAVESPVRGVADGLAGRVDRLRACGNGVVSVVAAVAFRTLWARLHGREGVNGGRD